VFRTACIQQLSVLLASCVVRFVVSCMGVSGLRFGRFC
jgi:hypothetical protein